MVSAMEVKSNVGAHSGRTPIRLFTLLLIFFNDENLMQNNSTIIVWGWSSAKSLDFAEEEEKKNIK